MTSSHLQLHLSSTSISSSTSPSPSTSISTLNLPHGDLDLHHPSWVYLHSSNRDALCDQSPLYLPSIPQSPFYLSDLSLSLPSLLLSSSHKQMSNPIKTMALTALSHPKHTKAESNSNETSQPNHTATAHSLLPTHIFTTNTHFSHFLLLRQTFKSGSKHTHGSRITGQTATHKRWQLSCHRFSRIHANINTTYSPHRLTLLMYRYEGDVK